MLSTTRSNGGVALHTFVIVCTQKRCCALSQLTQLIVV